MEHSFNGERLRLLIGDRPIVEVAKALQIPRASLYHWMQGKFQPSSTNVRRLAVFFGKSMDWFYQS